MASKSKIFPPSKRKTCASSDSVFTNDDSGRPLTRFSRIETGVPNRPDYRFILNKKCVYDADGDDENYLLTSFVNFDKTKDTSRSYSGEEITKRRARDDANALYYIKNIRHPHSSDDQSYNRSRSKSSKNESKGEYCSDEIWQKKSATLSNRFADYDCEMPKPVKNFTKTRGPHVICFEDDLRNFGHKPSPKAPRKESSGVSNTDKFKDYRFDKANTAEGYDNNMRSCFDQIRSSLLSSEGQAIDSNGGPEQYYISNRTHLLQPSTLKSSEKYEYL
ncbi:uncharacterized protein LOC135922804 [Gordionus sp. m RMFG-2023]|uniref:uncharacterized protein LOC135922804 n=1 Tax=Gordionus sp. m RMFG-2023 TaxID=3053472 RepID=UPI0031FD1D21